jgi:hypothetical protein
MIFFDLYPVHMNSFLFEISPSLKNRNAHRGLGILSAVFAFMLAVFILWAGISGLIGTWTIIILALPALLFASVSFFVLRFGNDYVFGVRVYSFGIGTYFPLKKNPEEQERIIGFKDIRMLEFEENMEVHRTGRQIKQFNVYRINVLRNDAETKELLADMTDLLP